jgi:hypothetical protein
MTRTGVDLVLGVFLWLWIVVAVVNTRRSAIDVAKGGTHVRAIWAAFAATSLAFAVLPHSIGWFGFVDGRLVPLMLMLGFLAVPSGALSARLHASFERGVPLAATAMVALVLGASFAFQKEARGYREVLREVPAGARLLNLPLDPNSHVFAAHPFVHYDKLALIERPVVVSDVWFHQGSAIYPTAQNPALFLPKSYIESDLRAVDWASYPLDRWDYVLIRTDASGGEAAVPGELHPVRHEGGWWLYRTESTRDHVAL